MRALFLKEIRSFLSSIIGYIFITIFLVISWLFLWVISDNYNILDSGTADLIPFFNFAPIVMLLLIPAITMRSFAEEKRTGTIELLYTRPISDFSILMSKYLAGVTLVIISLIPTFVFYCSVYYLGNPVGVIDTGATITSYLGLILLGASFVSIGIFASTLTSNQLISFILALFFCWFLLFGFGFLGSFGSWESLDFMIQYMGFDYHYESIKRGVIVLSDVVYFIGIIAFFLTASYSVLKSMRK